MANICSKVCQVKKYNFGCFYIDLQHETSGCDPEYGKFCAYGLPWVVAIQVKYCIFRNVCGIFISLILLVKQIRKIKKCPK